MLKLAEKRVSQIEKFTKDYNENEIEKIYFNERGERRQLITPIEPTWEQRVKEWRLKEYKGKGFREDAPIIMTEKGERVRSKSEKIQAYENNGFFQGERLILTYETEQTILNTSKIEQLVNRYLL